MTIDTRLAEIRARVEAATEGPWEWAAHTTVDGDKWAVFHGESTSALAMNNDGWAPDAEFIAASRTDLPALLAAVEAVRELADRLEWEADPANHLGSDLDYCRIATAQRIRTALTAALEVEG